MMVRVTRALIRVGAALAVVSLCAAGGCSSGSGTFSPDAGGGMDSTVKDAPSEVPQYMDVPHLVDTAGGDGKVTALIIKPENPVLSAKIPGPSLGTEAFQAFLPGHSTPLTATWSIDSPSLGSIDAKGTFKPSGKVAGIANVTAQTPSGSGTTTVTVKLSMTENPGGISSSVQTMLEAGGSADAGFKWLYPYDQTVFPRGLTPPVLQFAGTAPDAVYVHATSNNLDYKGFFGASSPGQVTWSTNTWTTLSESAGGPDQLKVEITKISGGAVSGPITETWTLAQGSLKGTIYYNSYDSALGGGQGTVLKMKPGTPAAVLEGGASGCKVCHAVSGDGSMLTLSNGDYMSGTSYSLSPKGATQDWAESDSKFSFAGLYPDGTLALTNGALPGSWPPNVPGMEQGPRPSQLMNPKTGAVIPASGFDGVVTYAEMPTFSPDGKKVVFNHYDTGSGHTIAVMDFNVKSHSFSGLLDIVNDTSHYVGWPAFLPDSKEFVFHADSGADFATWDNNLANIEIADLATKKVTSLDALNGISKGKIYLPYGMSDANMNYEPTVLPVAVGGYYWVVFTSRREYGNTITDPNPWASSPAIRKKLWVSAIDLDPVPGTDPSHPAFYINDQELMAGNMRGFWALDPCQMDGTMCTSGDQCCSGFCRQTTVGGKSEFTCVLMPGGCAQEYEKCNVSSDCCGASAGYQCINGFCAQPPPTK